MQIRHTFPALLLIIAGLFFAQCSASDNETWQEPTQGVVTTVKEVSPGEYKIADETTVPRVADSRVIVQNLNGEENSYTLEEVKMIQEIAPDTSAVNRPFRSAGSGFFGYLLLGRMMMGRSPSAGAYVNQSAYNKANSTTGTSLRNSARTVSRPGGRSGSNYGGSRSTRSVGG